MTHVLTHYHRRGAEPFRSLSALPAAEAIPRMTELYVPGSVLWERFADPARYLTARLRTERWLREAFVAKGGAPRDAQPIYFVLGASSWFLRVADPVTRATTETREVPLSAIPDAQLSFTYPDSMISLLLAARRDQGLYDARFHGHVFTRREMLAIVTANGLPDEVRKSGLPDSLPDYVEAQVWDRTLLG